MQSEHKACPNKLSFEETEEGYAIHVKGDKEKLKARLEVLEAFLNFKEKAQKAGVFQNSNHNCSSGFLSLIHRHIQVFHRNKHTC